MRAMWSGTISFGLVNIPVQLYSAVQEEELSFHLLHKKDLSPVRFARVCREDGHEVPWEEIVKGYEVGKGTYVVVTEEDFRKVAVKRTQSIEILKFSDQADIQPAYFEKPYYLEPDKGADKAYALLREALEKSKKVGIAKVVFRNKEHLAALKAEGELLVVHTLRFAEEIREPDLRLPAKAAAKPAEMKMALQLIEQMSGPFKPAEYKDDYTVALKQMIERKAHGKPLPKAERAPQPTKVPDLVAALRRSLEKPSKERHAEHPTLQ